MWTIPIIIHSVAVALCLGLGIYLLTRAKGTRQHRILGWIWVGFMAMAAISSFFIHTIRQFYGFSWLHFLAVYVLFSLIHGVYAARHHQVKTHRGTMLGLFWFGLVGAGLFTLLPSRRLGQIVWGWLASF